MPDPQDLAPDVVLPLDDVHALALRVLTRHGLSGAHAQAIANVVTQGQRDECHSHGVYRLLVCVRSLRLGKVDPQAVPTLRRLSSSIVSVDAHRGFSLLAFETGLPVLVEMARRHGIAAMTINRCYHFSALWPEVEAIAAHGLAGIAMNPSHSWVAPEGGAQPVFGTNPLAFAWPRPGGLPFVFDFATSAIARGDIELHAKEDKPIPPHWAIDANGKPTTDPKAALQGAMRTFGGHKGSALAAMVELMGGALIGDMTSLESMAFDDGVGATPCHGELVVAFDPKVFLGDDLDAGLARGERMLDAIVAQGARLPSQRRFDARARSVANGVRIPARLHDEILALLD
ncbi:Ldh family oxidoreductase [Burkholderia pseudomallei]|uniref:Malate/L-lactate dehydrogenase family protein n=1 Tax=Burkholderia oklahomensis TaxID=342113 RepID=A0AAI8BA92_9BURK|nr:MULTISPECIES: Ldh family oxidoreductase [pseudomallei group]AIO68552.1 malate/L-lactate dehydrogenase family protein [Burkholderia oklahomensis]AJX34954.1 malate/L-lactate dehydrogenase family protein [Burkholderia oklahomensis C6786]AOI40066.1 oxidoreductase [Burkholderia oklahomensis EO147]AOI49734.1 oxidoreductase [Burkholderia oklahomensis C6786]ARM03533.1 oxidoreductase [Burkholderia pseudomallei]